MCAAFFETWSFAQYSATSRTRDTHFLYFVYLLSTLYIIPCGTLHSSFGRTWTILWILSPPCRRSAGNITDRRSRDNGVGGVDAGSPAIHRPRCHSHVLSVLDLSFAEYSQVWSPWTDRPWPYDFGPSCIFLHNKPFLYPPVQAALGQFHGLLK